MEKEILKYLSNSPHTWLEIAEHFQYQFGPVRQALDNLLDDGRVKYDGARGLYYAAR